MQREEAEKRIIKLTEELNAYNHAYYIEDQSLISDYEFDMKLEELQELEEKFPELADENSPSKRVGGEIIKSFKTIKHRYPMLSLANSYNRTELMEFDNRVQRLAGKKVTYVCELKYDGVAIGITYKNGRLQTAITRGNGEEGDEITANVKT